MEPDGTSQTAAQWVTQHSQHKKNIRLVLMELAGFIDAGNDCPSQKELADKTGLSKDTIRRCLAELQKDGTVAIVKNGGGKVKGGHKDCYRLPKYTHTASSTQLVAPNYQHTASSTVQPVKHEQPESSTGEYVHTDSDTAGEKDLSEKLSAKEKDKKIPLPEKTGKETATAKREKPSREPTPEGIEWADLITAIGEIFGAFKIEATNYANMLTGRAKKGKWGLCAFEVPVIAAELRQWWRWYKNKNPNVERVKDTEKVYSSITEWRNQVKSRPPQPVSAFDGMPRIKPVVVDGKTGMHQTLPDSVYDQLRPSWKVSR